MSKGLLDDLRTTSIDIVADFAEAAHRAKRPADEVCDSYRCGDGSRPRGDFLYDYTRLSLGYLNQLARLGSAYTTLPGRLLERLYADAACPEHGGHRSGSKRGQCEEVAKGETAVFQLKVRNCLGADQKVRFFLPKFKDTRTDDKLDCDVTLQVDGAAEREGTEVDLDEDEKLKIRLEVQLKRGAKAKRTYCGRLNMVFSDAPPQSFELYVRVTE